MKKFYILIFVATLLFSGCESDDLTNLKDVFYVKYKNAEMPAYVYGNASDKVFLIILHGGPGGKGLEYRFGGVMDLEKDVAVVYFDQRNSGGSTGNYSSDEITPELMAEDVLALVKILRHKYGQDITLFVLGHSWGGTLGSEVMLQNQSEFNGWIEVDGGHNLKGLFAEQITYYKTVANEQIALGNSVSFWNGVLDKVNSLDSTNPTDENISELNQLGYECEGILKGDGVIADPADISGSIGSSIYQTNPTISMINSLNVSDALNFIWTESDYTPRLSQITIPAMVMWGRYDLVIPYAQGEEAYAALGSTNKTWVLFDSSGHSPMADEANLFYDEVITFINANK